MKHTNIEDQKWQRKDIDGSSSLGNENYAEPLCKVLSQLNIDLEN